jgi:two-component system chemotaxis response regulator CheB
MAKRDIFVVGGSAGSTEPLKALLAELPPDFPGAVLVVTHIPAKGGSHLRALLAGAGALPVAVASHDQEVVAGHVYLAPADRHLLAVDGRIHLGEGPRENMVRPAIDPLFRSAALAYGPRATAIVLSGMLNDGASGACAVVKAGGGLIVQDPSEALAPDMPLAALAVADAERVLKARDIGRVMIQTAAMPAGPAGEPDPLLRLEVDIANGARLGTQRLEPFADPVALSCPHCSGVLSEMKHQVPLRYRCQTGHAYSAQALYENGSGAVEEAIRVALRIMEERVELVTRMAADASRTGRRSVAELYGQRAVEYGEYADILRRAAMLTLRDTEAGTATVDEKPTAPLTEPAEKD